MPTSRRHRGNLGGIITAWLASQPHALLAVLGVAVFAALSIIRFRTSPGLSFGALYLVPISFFTWFIGLGPGIAAALSSAGLLLAFDLVVHGARAHPYWDTLLNVAMFVFVVFILAEVKALYERERDLSRTDAMTGLLNRRAFMEGLDRERARHRRFPRPLTLVYLDLDNFKGVNDTHGHAAGDELLRSVAEAMSASVRDVDSVGRLGGDEFAILMPETDGGSSAMAVTKVEKRLHEMAADRWPVTFSIGAVTFEAVPDSAEEMIRLADAVMYEVKQSGKNRTEFQKYPTA
jgi:diguanylate cyclase (GGDEF)-like protein